MAKKQLVAIGDCTVDTFIKLHDASVRHLMKPESYELCISYGDKVPYEDLKVIPGVGNSANIAVGSARLGHSVKFMSAVGDDVFGRQILDVYKKEKIDIGLVNVNKKKSTNNHFVLNFKGERTILVKHQDFKYQDVKRIGNPDWVFFSSVAESMLPFHTKLANYLSRHRDVKLGFNPGTFQIKLGIRKLASVYKRTDALFVNRNEAQRVLNTKQNEIRFLLSGLHKLGPRIVVITDGPQGAYASNIENSYYIPIYPDLAKPKERTGAGDGFTAAFISALMYGLSFEEALLWGPVNSSSIVQYIGAQEGQLTKSQLLGYLRKAPKKYQLKKI